MDMGMGMGMGREEGIWGMDNDLTERRTRGAACMVGGGARVKGRLACLEYSFALLAWLDGWLDAGMSHLLFLLYWLGKLDGSLDGSLDGRMQGWNG